MDTLKNSVLPVKTVSTLEKPGNTSSTVKQDERASLIVSLQNELKQALKILDQHQK